MFLPSERDVSLVLIVGLLLGHAAVSQVRFEFGMGFVVPEQLVVIPMLLLLPAALRTDPDRRGRRARPYSGLPQGKLVEGSLAEADRGLVAHTSRPS